MKMFSHVEVKLTPVKPGLRRPFGDNYKAKGAYRNGNKCVVVGCIAKNINTLRMSYHKDEVVSIKFVEDE